MIKSILSRLIYFALSILTIFIGVYLFIKSAVLPIELNVIWKICSIILIIVGIATFAFLIKYCIDNKEN